MATSVSRNDGGMFVLHVHGDATVNVQRPDTFVA
jgi:hypothetical protein